MPYKSSSKPRRKRRQGKTTKEPGKFEIGAFGIVIGFALGLSCGIFMVKGNSSPTAKEVVAEMNREHSKHVEVADTEEARLRASIERLRNSGKDVDILNEQYVPQTASKVDKLNSLLADDSGPITLDDL